MKKDDKDSTFRFGIVEDDGKNVTIEIREEDYERQRAAGVPEDELLSVGLHKARRGGFRERHPNFNPNNVEIKVIKDENKSSAENDRDKKAA